MTFDPRTAGRWWIRSVGPEPVRLRLICFPMAGGAASLFGGWAPSLPGIEIHALQMPGRENRLREPLIHDLREATTAVVASFELLSVFGDDMPVVFFGYSLGALLAFETVRALRRAGKRLPRKLIAAAAPAPDCDRSHIPKIHALPNAEIIAQLRNFQGTPDAILQNGELMALLLPVIRADFEMLETYRYVNEPPLPLSLAALGGLSDADVRPDELAQWGSHTAADFAIKFLPGGHFFIKSAPAQLLAEIVRLTAV